MPFVVLLCLVYVICVRVFVVCCFRLAVHCSLVFVLRGLLCDVTEMRVCCCVVSLFVARCLSFVVC